MAMSVYMLFVGDRYYPQGGTEDLIVAFRADSDEEAVAFAEYKREHASPHDWAYLATLTDSLEVRVVWDPERFCEVSW